jgi:hypothetical protein
MAFRAHDGLKRSLLWRRKAEEMTTAAAVPAAAPAVGRAAWSGIVAASLTPAQPPVIAPSAASAYFQAVSMRAAEAQNEIDMDWLPGEKGPTSAVEVESRRVEKRFLVAIPIDAETPVDALVTCLGSLLRARIEDEPYGEIRITLYHPAAMPTEPFADVWDLPWEQAGVQLRFRPVADVDAGAGAIQPLACGALGRLRAMNAAIGAIHQMQCQLLWIEPAVLFGTDPMAELYTYALDMAFMGSYRGGRAYTTAAMLIPFSASARAREVITALRGAVMRDLKSGNLRHAAHGARGSVELLDGYLTRLLTGRAFHYRVFARTRFIPMSSPAQIIAARVPLALTLPTRSTAEEFLTAVDAFAKPMH